MEEGERAKARDWKGRRRKDGGGGGRETERWKEKGGRRGGSDVRDDGARSKVSQKSQMSLDLLARQLPETSGIPKMAEAAPRSSTSDGKLPRYLQPRTCNGDER